MVSDPHCTNKDILGHTVVKIPPCVKKAKKMTAEEYNTACIHAKIVWLKARGSKDKVIAILCTDLSLSDEEVIRYYSARFNIEFGFFNYMVTGQMSIASQNFFYPIFKLCTIP